MEKAKAKTDREEAKRNNIQRTAEFELCDMADEDFANATPRPPFTPKHLTRPRNQDYSGLTPIAATSEADPASDFDGALFNPASDDSSDKDDTANSATEDDAAKSDAAEDDKTQDKIVEDDSDVPSPPPSRLKRQRTGKAAVTTKTTARRKKQVDELESEVEVMPPPRKTQSRRKATKEMLRADIDMAAQKIREDRDLAGAMSQGAMGGGLESEVDMVSFDSDFMLIFR
jgi:hypothetical protein